MALQICAISTMVDVVCIINDSSKDVEERKKKVKTTHETLISILQRTNAIPSTTKFHARAVKVIRLTMKMSEIASMSTSVRKIMEGKWRVKEDAWQKKSVL